MTLVLACVLAGGWVRSIGVADFIVWSEVGQSWELNSENGTLEVRCLRLVRGSVSSSQGISWDSVELVFSDGSRQGLESYVDHSKISEKKSEFLGVVVSNGRWSEDDCVLQIFVVATPYRNVVLPLILLSAYLLWKPRKREAKRISEDKSN